MNDEIDQLMISADSLLTAEVYELRSAKRRTEANIFHFEALNTGDVHIIRKLRKMKLRVQLLDQAIKLREPFSD